jgi:hypothetical protein
MMCSRFCREFLLISCTAVASSLAATVLRPDESQPAAVSLPAADSTVRWDLVEYGPDRVIVQFPFIRAFAQREVSVDGQSRYWVNFNGFQLRPEDIRDFLRLADAVNASADKLLPQEPAEGANIRWYGRDSAGQELLLFYRVRDAEWYFEPRDEEWAVPRIAATFQKVLKDIEAMQKTSPRPPWAAGE